MLTFPEKKHELMNNQKSFMYEMLKINSTPSTHQYIYWC